MSREAKTKRCTSCDEVKPIDAFTLRRRRNLQPDTMCRSCRSVYGKEHYAANKARYIALAAERTRKKRLVRTAYLIEYFEQHPCVDCGETDPLVLEFDHLRDKAFDIGQGFEWRPWQVVLDEIAKCEVVCGNCHARRTAFRRGSVRAALLAARAAAAVEAGDGT